MDDYPILRIESDSVNGGETSIWLGDWEVSSFVEGIQVTMAANDQTVATIAFILGGLTINAPVAIEIMGVLQKEGLISLSMPEDNEEGVK